MLIEKLWKNQRKKLGRKTENVAISNRISQQFAFEDPVPTPTRTKKNQHKNDGKNLTAKNRIKDLVTTLHGRQGLLMRRGILYSGHNV